MASIFLIASQLNFRAIKPMPHNPLETQRSHFRHTRSATAADVNSSADAEDRQGKARQKTHRGISGTDSRLMGSIGTVRIRRSMKLTTHTGDYSSGM